MSRPVLALGALVALAAAAQPPAPPAKGSAPRAAVAPAPAPGKPARSDRVIRLEELRVEGRIQKPEAFYLLQRSQLSFGELQRTESFLPKVVESVEKAPF